jgi:hypothetical protein
MSTENCLSEDTYNQPVSVYCPLTETTLNISTSQTMISCIANMMQAYLKNQSLLEELLND